MPTSADSDGHHAGVPVPRPIMPPLMCVLPQADGAPSLVPMLPAMYMATCGKNTPELMGTVPLQQSHVDGLAGMPQVAGLASAPPPPPPPAPLPMQAQPSAHLPPALRMGPPPFGGPADAAAGPRGPGLGPQFGAPGGAPMWMGAPGGGDGMGAFGTMPGGWPNGFRRSGSGGGRALSTLPPLVAETPSDAPGPSGRGAQHSTLLRSGSRKARASGGGTGGGNGGAKGSRGRTASQGLSGDALEKGDKLWTPKAGRSDRRSSRSATRASARARRDASLDAGAAADASEANGAAADDSGSRRTVPRSASHSAAERGGHATGRRRPRARGRGWRGASAPVEGDDGGGDVDMAGVAEGDSLPPVRPSVEMADIDVDALLSELQDDEMAGEFAGGSGLLADDLAAEVHHIKQEADVNNGERPLRGAEQHGDEGRGGAQAMEEGCGSEGWPQGSAERVGNSGGAHST